jgi:hypothetical protein
MSEAQIDERQRKDRSPSFPFISLPKAIERAGGFAANHKRSPTRIPVAAATWGYGSKSSGLLQTLAALRSYGLLEDLGSGADRKVQLTDLAWRILHDARSGAREQAIREAALKPRLFAEHAAWHSGRPSDAHCISELQFDRGFTPDAAKLFLKVFDETLSFADLGDGDSVSADGGDEDQISQGIRERPNRSVVEVGDLVQWESQGTWQFPEARRVREIKHDPSRGSFVFVEGTAGGLPLDQTIIVEKGASATASIAGESPGSSYVTVSGGTMPSAHGASARIIQRATFPLPEGLVALEIPEHLSAESFEDLEAWLQVMLRRARRSVAGAGSTEPAS